MMFSISEIDYKIGLYNYYLNDIPPLCLDCKCRYKNSSFYVEEKLSEEIIKKIRKTRRKDDITILLVNKGWGKDTLNFRRYIAYKLGVKEKDIIILGIKDSRATAKQFFFIRKQFSYETDTSIIGYISYKDFKKDYRNYFEVIVKCKGLNQEAVELLSRKSLIIPNFFGYQRFGGLRFANHIVGELIIRRQFEKAVLTFLTHYSRYEPETHVKWRRELANTLNFKTALKEAPRGLYYERKILLYLIKDNNYLKALRALPFKLKRLLVESFQSYLFNLFLSERINKDLPIDTPIYGDYYIDIIEEKIQKANFNLERKYRYLLLIPLVGYIYKLHDGPQGEIEKKILNELNLKPRDFYIKEADEFSLRGGFRRAIMGIHHNLVYLCNNETIHISSILDKGCYMTILLREIFKPKDPVVSGFSS